MHQHAPGASPADVSARGRRQPCAVAPSLVLQYNRPFFLEATMRRTLLLMLLLLGGAGLNFLATLPALAASRDREEWVKYNDVPKDVQRALDRERRNHDIKRIDYVVRNGREFYRAIIDERGDDLVVRVDREGRVISREDVNDVPMGRERGGAAARDDRVDRVADDAERQVRYASLPRGVKETLDRERRSRDVKAIYEVRRGDRTFYRAIVDERNGDRMVRIGESGKLLSAEDIREARLAGGYLDPRYDDRGVRRSFDEGGEVAYDRLPGEVKAALGREAGADRVGRVVHYRNRDGIEIYRAEIVGPNRSHIVRVDGRGRFVGERETTEPGKQFVRYADLPGRVKDTIGREVPRNRLGTIVQITRDNRTYYRAEIDEGAWSRWITIQDDGRVTGEIERLDTDDRRR